MSAADTYPTLARIAARPDDQPPSMALREVRAVLTEVDRLRFEVLALRITHPDTEDS